jgi:hypothetical protein
MIPPCPAPQRFPPHLGYSSPSSRLYPGTSPCPCSCHCVPRCTLTKEGYLGFGTQARTMEKHVVFCPVHYPRLVEPGFHVRSCLFFYVFACLTSAIRMRGGDTTDKWWWHAAANSISISMCVSVSSMDEWISFSSECCLSRAGTLSKG